MIDPDKRNAIYQLHLEGMPLREISRRFQISRHTVRKIIRQQGAMPQTRRSDKIEIDSELLERLYHECEGYIQRVHEKLTEEEEVQVSYPTLTHLLREMGLSKSRPARCDRVPDEPGEEMQHDTSVYQIRLAGGRTKLIASSVYLRYSKRRYLKFYRTFNRFAMKCFLHEALMYWGYAARKCIIDNTNLARWLGSGKRAVIAPEMACFARQYGFEFLCHEIRHSNRKAGEERSFRTVQTSFLKGRTFENLEDLNAQAVEWATVRWHHRRIGKTGLIPAKAFEVERSYLTKLPRYLPAPYQTHERGTDQYGYVPFNANYYWVPGDQREDVKLLEYADRVKLFQHRQCVAEYLLPADGVKNKRISPEGQPQPRYQPNKRKRSSTHEEKRLRAMGPAVQSYVDYVLKTPGIKRHRFLRELLALSRQVTPTVFTHALERALRYRIANIPTLHRIAWFCMSQGQGQAMPYVDIDETYRERPAYQEGSLTDEPDFSIYDPKEKEETEPHEDEVKKTKSDEPESEEDHG